MKKNIIIKNMTCGSCVALNNSTIESMKGVKSVQINLSNGQAIIDFEFACTNHLLVDIGVTINSFCFDEEVLSKQQR